MPLLTLTKPGEAKQWVPWWVSIFFTDPHQRGKKRGARPAPQKYQYEICKKPIPQHSCTATEASPPPSSYLRKPHHTTPKNDLFSLSPLQGHRQVRFADDTPWATNAPSSTAGSILDHRLRPDCPEHNRHEVIVGRDMHDIQSRNVRQSPLVSQQAMAQHDFATRHSLPRSFYNGYAEHYAKITSPHSKATTHKHCTGHCHSLSDAHDTALRSERHDAFHDALQRQFREDLGRTGGPHFHTNDGYIHPVAKRYMHPDAPRPHDPLPWRMKAGHRGHIHYTHRAAYQHHPAQVSIKADPYFDSPSSKKIGRAYPRKTVVPQDFAAGRRISYERTRSTAPRYHQVHYHHHPLRCHPLDSGLG